MIEQKNFIDIPLYKQIERKILEDIHSGKYRPGYRIPTQEWFVETYGVSRVTVRKAIRELIDRSILISQKGGGTYVNEIAMNHHGSNRYNSFISNINRLGGFTSNLNRNGQSAKSQILDISLIECNKLLGEALSLSIGSPIVGIRRLRRVNDTPVSVEMSYINKSLVPELDFLNEFLDNMSLYNFLVSRGGLRLSHANENIFAVNALPEISDLLDIPEDKPILYVKRSLYTESRDIIEYCEIHCRTDIYMFSVDYPA